MNDHEDAIKDATIKEGVPETVFQLLDALTPEQREAVFAAYCVHCGSTDPHCVCWNDE